MKRITLTICAAAFLFAACNNESKTESSTTADSGKTASATTPEKETTEPYVAPDSAAVMKAWMDYATPGEMHKLMASSDGVWEGEVSHWMSPDAPPEKSKATSTNKTILNGLYQESVHKGNMMGMQFEGKSIMGYDNFKKKFVSTWVDNMGSGIMTMEGDYDPATKTFNFAGECVNPATGKDMKLREVFKIVDDNTQVMEMYGPDMKTGKEYKTMEIVMKRKK